MKITLTNEKAKAIVQLGNEIFQTELVVIRKLAQYNRFRFFICQSDFHFHRIYPKT
jgi:hypothetical protein